MVNFVVRMDCEKCGYEYRDTRGRFFASDAAAVGNRVRIEGDLPCSCSSAEYIIRELHHVNPDVPYGEHIPLFKWRPST